MKVAVIGGGISGLTAAYKLSQQGAEVTLLERNTSLGGLAASFDTGNYWLEKYYHFVCGGDFGLFRLIEELGISEELHWNFSETSFFYEGKLYPFRGSLDLFRFSPLSFFSRIRFGLSVLYARYMKNWQRLDKIPAREWLIKIIGEQAYQVIWEPLLRIKFGHYHDQISAAWLCHRIHRISQSRPHWWEKEKMGYMTGGSKTLMDRLSQKISTQGGKIHLNTPVSQILAQNDRVTGIEFGGERHSFDKVVAAIPIPRLIRLLPENTGPLTTQFTESLLKINYIGVVCMVLRLKHSITDYFWVNINDFSLSINGIIEYTNLNPCPRLQGDKIVYVPFYLPTTEARYTYSSPQLYEEYCRALAKINPDFDTSWVVDYRVFRNPYAQAICTTDFWQKIPQCKTPLTNFYFLDSIHIYPEDHTLSGMARLAYEVSDLVLEKNVFRK